MSSDAALADRAAELRRVLAYHARRYYVDDDPEIGDDEYDALYNELRDLEGSGVLRPARSHSVSGW